MYTQLYSNFSHLLIKYFIELKSSNWTLEVFFLFPVPGVFITIIIIILLTYSASVKVQKLSQNIAESIVYGLNVQYILCLQL